VCNIYVFFSIVHNMNPLNILLWVESIPRLLSMIDFLHIETNDFVFILHSFSSMDLFISFQEKYPSILFIYIKNLSSNVYESITYATKEIIRKYTCHSKTILLSDMYIYTSNILMKYRTIENNVIYYKKKNGMIEENNSFNIMYCKYKDSIVHIYGFQDINILYYYAKQISLTQSVSSVSSSFQMIDLLLAMVLKKEDFSWISIKKGDIHKIDISDL